MYIRTRIACQIDNTSRGKIMARVPTREMGGNKHMTMKVIMNMNPFNGERRDSQQNGICFFFDFFEIVELRNFV